MRFVWRYLGLAFIAAGQACAQSTASEWFPAHVGDQSIYEHVTRDEDGEGRARLVIQSWRTEETTTGAWAIPEGMLLAKQVRVTEGSAPPGWRVNPSPTYLIRGDCLYSEVGWDPSARQLTPDFRKGLEAYLSPDFCFPLVTHKVWGAPHGLPDWGVTRPEDAKDWQVIGMTRRGKQPTFHIRSISSYPGAGVTSDIWFEKGVGIVREEEIHHGTIGERQTWLVRFEPAAQR